jgi:hypothetical protein
VSLSVIDECIVKGKFELGCHSEPEHFALLSVNSAEAKNLIFGSEKRDFALRAQSEGFFGLRPQNDMHNFLFLCSSQ